MNQEKPKFRKKVTADMLKTEMKNALDMLKQIIIDNPNEAPIIRQSLEEILEKTKSEKSHDVKRKLDDTDDTMAKLKPYLKDSSVTTLRTFAETISMKAHIPQPNEMGVRKECICSWFKQHWDQLQPYLEESKEALS